jgi:peptidoglycan/xylan/chitin deacetylase (PgdA/CDA1 family)
MRFLQDSGYRVITLDDAIRLLSVSNDCHRTETGRYAVITFDDGFLDFYTEAFPILESYDFTATVFLPTSFINDTNTTISGQSFLSWPQVRELAKAGISFGSHSVSHKYLARLSQEQVDQELRVSRETIENQTGKDVLTFSYPYAYPEDDRQFVSFMTRSMQKSGYSGAVTTRIGTADFGNELFCLKRIPVNSEDDTCLFRAKLEGGYNWMHAVQYSAKAVRGMLGMRRRKILAKWSTPY